MTKTIAAQPQRKHELMFKLEKAIQTAKLKEMTTLAVQQQLNLEESRTEISKRSKARYVSLLTWQDKTHVESPFERVDR
jgi:hypothetical protein